jgi:hypothetical protein
LSELARVGSSVLGAYGGVTGTSAENLSSGEVSQAFKQALGIGVSDVVVKLGKNDGFNLDPKIHVPLPEKLKSVQSFMSKVGMSYMLDDLELRMNRAAEQATPHVKELFLAAVSDMSFEDVWSIYRGADDSATQYFKSKMSEPLKVKMRPIVDEYVSKAGVVSSYDQVMASYRQIPFVPDVKADLTDHVLQKGVDGIFYYLALEEKEIRNDPVRHTTELLKKVFGS